MSVGGDYYDVSDTNEITRIFLADTIGHGVSASLMTLLIKSEYDKIKFNSESLALIFKKLNQFFAENYRTLKTFFTGVIVDININNQSLLFASAGHHEQFFISNGTLLKLTRTGRAVGIAMNSEFGAIELPYSTNDKLFLFTDGVFEEFNLNREEFGIDRLEQFVMQHINLDGRILIEELMRAVDNYISEEQMNDDLTFLAVDFLDRR
jgi:sigma-B regulation protein RsbU (phosphoserine phosphatase)